MNASELTNEELSKELEEAAKLYECEDGEEEREEHAILIECAKRLKAIAAWNRRAGEGERK